MWRGFITSLLLLVALPCLLGLASSADLNDQCSGDLGKLTDCYPYATGKEDSPSDGCCNTVKEIRESNPVCLCYLIQKAHSSEQAVFSVSLQIDKLVKLPRACSIANTNITLCPVLLRLPPGSPDNALFNGSGIPRYNTTLYNNSSFSSQASYARIIVAALGIIILSSVFNFGA